MGWMGEYPSASPPSAAYGTVLMCAGIDPNERTVKGMMEFVRRGVRTSVALSREESERQHAARAEAEAA